MARGKYLSLEEARQLAKLDEFAEEHPSEGDEKKFESLLDAMVHGEAPKPKSSKADGGT
jgi:hypothetical protein